MASLIKVDAKDNITGKKLLLFSNPNTTKGRNHITIKASLDGGLTWPAEHQVLLDEDEGMGIFLPVHDRQGNSRYLLRVKCGTHDLPGCQANRPD